jgi:thiol-disulfide isomerase/thioredoxin
MRNARYSVASAILLLVLCGIAPGQAKTPPSDPTFKLQGLDGKIVDLSAERGNVLLVSFGATWCVPCTTELNSLNEVLSEYRDKPVKFFWVSVERSEQISNGELKRYARARKLAFPVLRDTGQMVFLQFAEKVRLPMIIMLDKDGKVAGPATFGVKPPAESYKAEIRARLNKLLEDKTEVSFSGGLPPAIHNRIRLDGGLVRPSASRTSAAPKH